MTLKANNLSCIRQHNALFADLSFELSVGNIILVEGNNGSGKSSLLRLLVGLATPHAGDVLWHETNIQNVRDEYVKQLHYVGHTNGIKLGLTVAENLELASVMTDVAWMRFSHPGSGDEQRIEPGCEKRIQATLQSLDLIQHANTPAKHLSAGQQRKISLAKLFIYPKKLWILDEPFTALDANSQQLFILKLEEHLNQGGMCIMTSHHAVRFQQITPITLRLSS